jgi:DNA-binding response OmpR family regulator
VALRRAGEGDAPQGYRDENWEIEFDAYIVRYHGSEIRLTHKEFELFRYLVERAGRVLTRERLLERVWGYESDVETRSIDAHIRRLRLKLGSARRHVETVVGLGYRFVR